VVGDFVFLAFGSRERHAVVGGDDDDGVVEQTAFLEELQHSDQVLVEPFDLEGVVQHVGSDGFIVRPPGGNPVDLVDRFPAFGDTGAEFVTAMGFMATVPEAERFAGWEGIEEVLKVRCVVVRRDAWGWRTGFASIKGGSCQVAGFAVFGAGDAGGPAFAGFADVVAELGEDLGISFEFGRKIAPVVAGGFELPGVSASEEAGAGWSAFGVGGVSVGEEEAFAGHAVESWGMDPWAAVGAHVRVRGVVGDADEEVRSIIGGVEE